MSDDIPNEVLLRYLMHAVEADFDSARDAYSERVLDYRARVLARMSSPSHDRAMAEGGWQPAANGSDEGLGDCPETRADDPIAWDSWIIAFNVAEHMRGHGAHDEGEYLARLREVTRACVASTLRLQADVADLAPPTPTTQEGETP